MKALKHFTRPYEYQPYKNDYGKPAGVLYMSMLTLVRRQNEFIKVLTRYINGLDELGKASE